MVVISGGQDGILQTHFSHPTILFFLEFIVIYPATFVVKQALRSNGW